MGDSQSRCRPGVVRADIFASSARMARICRVSPAELCQGILYAKNHRAPGSTSGTEDVISQGRKFLTEVTSLLLFESKGCGWGISCETSGVGVARLYPLLASAHAKFEELARARTESADLALSSFRKVANESKGGLVRGFPSGRKVICESARAFCVPCIACLRVPVHLASSPKDSRAPPPVW